MKTIRKALEGIVLPPGAEVAITAAEKKQRDDESYIQFLESKLPKGSKEDAKPPSSYRQEWERSRNPSQGSHSARIEEIKEKILVFLSNRDDCIVQEVARGVAAGVQVAQYHLDELQEAGMVRAAYAMDSPVYWTLDHKGRGYLISNKADSTTKCNFD